MTATQPKLSPEESSRREREVYERVVKPQLRPEDHGKFVAVDALTGEFEVDASELDAGMRLRGRLPEADIWIERAGYPTAHTI